MSRTPSLFARLWPDSMIGRTLLVLVLALLLSHLLLFAIHYGNRMELLSRLGGRETADRMAAAIIVLDEASPGERSALIRSLNGPGFRVGWSREPLAREEPKEGVARSLAALLRESLGRDVVMLSGRLEGGQGMGFGMGMGPMHSGRYAGPPRGPYFLTSLRLSDGSWINFAQLSPEGRPDAQLHPGFLVSLLLVTLSALGITIWAVRRAIRPLADLAAASERLGRDVAAPPLPEDGPREVRQAAGAFNEMQRRLKRFIDDRTHMLGAISHDLRTPITRMRLRAEFLEEEEVREKMLADLAEMEAMVASALEFARDAASQEAAEEMDLGALLRGLAEAGRETGADIRLAPPPSAPFTGRPLTLKRAIGNLIDNAVKYGNRADLSLSAPPEQYEILIEDEGPGIPEEEMERAFAPFQRLDPSRSRETGGVGLGLAAARGAIRAHGGEITMANRPEGGLRVLVSLPRK